MCVNVLISVLYPITCRQTDIKQIQTFSLCATKQSQNKLPLDVPKAYTQVNIIIVSYRRMPGRLR